MNCKIRFLILAMAAVFLTASLPAENYSFTEPFSRTAPFDPAGKIILENVNGDVDIRTWDRNEILVEGEKQAKTDEELKLIDLTMDLEASRGVIKVRLPKRAGFFSNNIRASVRFKISLPATATLEKISVVNSTVHIEGARASVNAESVNGSIHAHHVAGSVRLETVNGQIDAGISAVTPGQKLAFNTVNGAIAVRLPADFGADTHASVVNGSIDCDFPLTVHGHIVGKNLSGKIGDGRADFSAESVNGSIRLKKQASP